MMIIPHILFSANDSITVCLFARRFVKNPASHYKDAALDAPHQGYNSILTALHETISEMCND
jgi:hypothetical protein